MLLTAVFLLRIGIDYVWRSDAERDFPRGLLLGIAITAVFLGAGFRATRRGAPP